MACSSRRWEASRFRRAAAVASIAAVIGGACGLAGAHAQTPAPAVLAQPPAVADCTDCHEFAKDAYPSTGPNLWGVAGRKAGATDYDYSPAMKASGLTWTQETLRAYIAHPKDVVPAGKMDFPGQPDPAQLKAVVDYLMSLHD